MYRLVFTPADLDANRSGTLSPAQRDQLQVGIAMLRRQGQQTIMFFIGLFVVLTLVGIVVEYNNAGRDLRLLATPNNLIGFVIMISGFALLLLISLLVNNWHLWRMGRAVVHIVEGTAHVVNKVMYVRGSPLPVFNVELKRHFFSKFVFRFADAASLQHFEEGKRYRVYYLPAIPIPTALSVEELPD